jgi:Flp pilus assembly protein TadD
MRGFARKSLGLGIAAALLAGILTGCSTAGFNGASTYGNSTLQTAELAEIGNYPADRALQEARAHFRNNDFGYSAALYKRVVELRPKDAEGYVGLGASYDRLHRFDLADRVYASLYDITGGSAQYYNNLGYSYMLRGNLKDALTSFRKAEKLSPGNVVVANNMRILAKVAAEARA